MAQVGFEPTASLVLSESGLPVAYRAMTVAALSKSDAGGRTRTYIRWFKASELAC
jgi:hypothetical protein